MKGPNRTWGLLACLGLVLAANAVALGGVWYNRSVEPDSRLSLSERELRPAYSFARENSGIALNLNWRRPSTPDSPHGYDRASLSEEQMLALGFSADDYARDSRQLSREVLVVLELDGPAYQEELRRQQQRLERAQALLKTRPKDAELERQLEFARTSVEQERTSASRLFAIDVGLDPDALRQRYPDRRRYAIVQALVHPWFEGNPLRLTGQVSRLSVEEIHVPYAWRERFRQQLAKDGRHAYQVEVAIGRRMEPWITAVRHRNDAD